MDSHSYKRQYGLSCPRPSSNIVDKCPVLSVSLERSPVNYSVPGKFSKYYLSRGYGFRGQRREDLRQRDIELCTRQISRLSKDLESLKQNRTVLKSLNDHFEETVTKHEKRQKARLRLDKKMHKAAVLIQSHARKLSVRVKYAEQLSGIAKRKFARHFGSLQSQMDVCKDILGEEIFYDLHKRPYPAEGTLIDKSARMIQTMCKHAMFRLKARPRLKAIKLFARATTKFERIKDFKMVSSAFQKFKNIVPKKNKNARQNARGKRGKAARPLKKPSRF